MLHLVIHGRCGVVFIDSKPWNSECGQEKKTVFFCVCVCVCVCVLLNWKALFPPPLICNSSFLQGCVVSPTPIP
jgi:hypothetical protein